MRARSQFAVWLVVGFIQGGLACDDSDPESTTNGNESAGKGSGNTGGSAGKTSSAGAGVSAGKGGAGASAGKGGTGVGGSAGAPTASAEPADYAKSENWLCRPGVEGDACHTNLDTTIVRADGTLEVETFKPNDNPEIDCFYVYPTVSLDATANSDLVPGAEEQSVVRAQFARYASQCRLYAPMYRQVTLTSLRATLGGATSTADRALPYQDVVSAWKYYLEHDNAGRGVVLVGHSQGSGVLAQLIHDELDKDPVDKRFIAALIAGTNVAVPKDKVVGGTFQHVPLCTAADELGCVISYASFRDNAPPPATSLFAMSRDASVVAGCTNPAALGGGSADLHSYLSTGGPGTSARAMGAWVTPEKEIKTPFVSVPGLLTAECKFATTGSYLSITVHGDAKDARTDEIVGDVVTNDTVNADWGLHVIDVHLALGNLLDVVRAKQAAYKAR